VKNTSNRLWGSPQSPRKCVPGFFAQDKSGRGVILATHLHLTPKIRMGATILLHHVVDRDHSKSFKVNQSRYRLGEAQRVPGS